MKHLTSGLVLILLAVQVLAQPFDDPKFKQKFNKADALTFDGSYLEALPLLEDLYAYDTSNANLNYLLGVCYLMGKKDHELAIKRLESATKDVSLEYQEANWKERKAPGIAYYYLGRAYHYKNRFDRAVTNYYNYRSFIEMDDVATYNQVRQQIQYAENAMELVKTPVGVKATNLGPTINTKYPDYCPVVSADGKVLIFTSRRAGGTSDVQDQDGNYYDDIYVCQRQPNGSWSQPVGIGTNINSAGHEAAIGLSPDGQLLFIYKDDNGDGNIYYSRKQADGWTKPEALGSDINTSSWETHATVNATQDLLIFVSNRSEGGHGGRDLWYCKRLPDGTWGLAMNMGSVINSQFEEDSPFISADGKTLIFSSQGHTSMGGFDIFRSEFEDGAWTAPENIGYPINTAEDDVFFVLTPDGRHAYYSSRMDGGYGDTDLYKLKLEVKKSVGAAVARGSMKVPAAEYANIKAQITVSDEGGAQLGIYRPNMSTGYYVLILPPGETYTVSYQADGYDPVVRKVPISDSETYEEYDGVIELDPVVFGEDILALKNETERLRKEQEATAERAAEQERLADEAALKAKEEAEQLALAKESEAERKKAEELAAKEKAEAARELEVQQEKERAADLARKEAEAKARFESEQELAAKKATEAKEAEEKDIAERERKAEEAKKAEQEALASAAAEAEARAAEDEQAKLVEEQAQAEKTVEETLVEQVAVVEEVDPQAELKKRIEENARIAREKAQAEQAAIDAQEEQIEESEEVVEEVVEVIDEQAELRKRIEENARIAREKAEAQQAALNEQEEAVEQSSEELAQAQAQAEEQARIDAATELKKRQLQERIQALKEQQESGTSNLPETSETTEPEPVKEVTVKEVEDDSKTIAVDADAIKAKREEMLARIAELKNQKAAVEKQKVADEAEVVKAAAKAQEAEKKKESLIQKSKKTQADIEELQNELVVVEKQVEKADEEVLRAKTEVEKAEEKVAQDIAEQKRIAEEASKKEQEAKEAEKQIKELEELERKRIEQERLAAEQFAKEQQEEAERARLELIQVEALAEQQRQVEAALKVEEAKKAKIEAAEATAFSAEERLSNATTIEQLRELSRQLIQDNLELKKQLAELNAKLDLILDRLDYAPDIEKVDLPSSSTMKNLQEGKRLILRNIFFDYNQAVLRSRSKHELNKLFSFLKDNPSVSIQVSGHTDSRGNDEYNMRLSRDRAQAVVDYLIRNGISKNRLTAVGYGETRPIARNENEDLTDNPVGRQLNRRIEISLPQGNVNGVEVEEIQVPSGARIK